MNTGTGWLGRDASTISRIIRAGGSEHRVLTPRHPASSLPSSRITIKLVNRAFWTVLIPLLWLEASPNEADKASPSTTPFAKRFSLPFLPSGNRIPVLNYSIVA